MSVVISYLKDNYLDLIAKAILSILSIVLLLLRSRASKKLKASEQLSAFLQWIPSAVKFANDLFPTHGDGAKRLNYVVEKCSTLFPLISLSTIVESVDQILEADKKKEVTACETSESYQTEGSQNFCENCKIDQFDDSTSEAASRRDKVISPYCLACKSANECFSNGNQVFVEPDYQSINFCTSFVRDTRLFEPKKD